MNEEKPVVLFDLADPFSNTITLQARGRDASGVEQGIAQALEFPVQEHVLRRQMQDMKTAVWRAIEKSDLL